MWMFANNFDQFGVGPEFSPLIMILELSFKPSCEHLASLLWEPCHWKNSLFERVSMNDTLTLLSSSGLVHVDFLKGIIFLHSVFQNYFILLYEISIQQLLTCLIYCWSQLFQCKNSLLLYCPMKCWSLDGIESLLNSNHWWLCHWTRFQTW